MDILGYHLMGQVPQNNAYTHTNNKIKLKSRKINIWNCVPVKKLEATLSAVLTHNSKV